MSLKNWNFFREKSEFLRDISISLKTVVRRGLPNAYQYNRCLKYKKENGVKIGTFFYICNRFNIKYQ